MGRHRQARHPQNAHHRWTHLLAGVPWITLVLLAVLALGTAELVRPRTYLATATLTAPTVAAADQLATQLADPDLRPRVEREVELDPELTGSVRLAVRDEEQEREVSLEATAPDPRLAALAADTGAAVVAQDRADGTSLSEAAEVPTEPVDRRGPAWLVAAAAALAVAVRVEGVHRAWLRDHPVPVPRGAR